MDMDGFLSCLSYIETSSSDSEIYVALGSVALGFLLSFIATHLQGLLSSRKKKSIFLEEVSSIKESAAISIGGAAEILDGLQQNKQPSTYTFGVHNSFTICTEYYPQVAHKFSSNQRSTYILAIEQAKRTALAIDTLKAAKLDEQYYVTYAFQIFSCACALHATCESLLNNDTDREIDVYKIATGLGLNYKFIQDLKK